MLFSADMFHPSAAGYALAAKQLLPALCNALGESIRRTRRGRALESRSAKRGSLLARVGGISPAVATHDRGTRADRRAARARFVCSLSECHAIV